LIYICMKNIFVTTCINIRKKSQIYDYIYNKFLVVDDNHNKIPYNYIW
jgi:hypothetical protein